MTALLGLLAACDPDPRARGRQFEAICSWYLSNDPQYRNALSRIWLWDEWPGRWGADGGIDLVAEDQEGRLWAIQAKAYGPQYSVTKADVDSFLAESSRAIFSFRLLISTTDRLSPNARRTIDAQDKPVGLVNLSDLMTADLEWPASPIAMRPPPPRAPAEPHEYQQDAIDAVVKRFESASRGQLIMACGTGKTLTAHFISRTIDANSTLVLVPSLSLLKQTMRVWQTQSPIEVLPVCSDETVSRAEDVAMEYVSEIGSPVTTDPIDIARFLRSTSGPRVVLCTYQSSPQIARAFAFADVPAFDLIVADEAHRCTGRQPSTFTTVLDENAIRAKRRLFMTATPRFFTGRVMKAASDVDMEVASMDDETTFGDVFHRLGFSEAINRGLLTDYQVAIIGVDDATYRSYLEEGTLVTRPGSTTTTNARSLAGQIGLAKAMRKYDLRRIITFHSRVTRAQTFAADLPAVIEWMPDAHRPSGDLWSTYTSGEMSAGARHVLLQRLTHLKDGERGLLANARCLAEGVDVPTLDGVAFIDPRRSDVDIVQAVGRAIRKADDKTIGTIVIPVFIDGEADAESALDDSAFRPVWDIVKALRAHDDDLAAQIDTLRRDMGRLGGAPRLPAKIQLDVPVEVGDDFIRAFDARLVEQTAQPWEFWFGLLQGFVDEHGHAVVLQTSSVDGHRLGSWVSIQRTHRSRGSLSAGRQRRLEGLPKWSWDPKAEQWEDGYRHLQAYAHAHGNAGVRDDYVCDDGYRLGKWVGKQRSKWDALSDDRRERLEGLSGWTRDARAALWERSFAALEGYVREHGHAKPPRGVAVAGIDIETWVRRQRRSWGELTEDRRQRLNSLSGWTLNALDEKWETGYRHLVAHVDLFGSAEVLQSHDSDDGYPLGKWVSVQRRTWDKISLERQRKLSSLPGWTLDARGGWWETWMGSLRAYVAEYGHARVPGPYVTADGAKLGSWVSNLRSTWELLSDERQHELQRLPGWTLNARTDAWENGFRFLDEFVSEYSHSRVPQAYVTDSGFRLGSWVANQKTNWSSLGDERQRRLARFPGWALNIANARWNENFDRLVKYVAEHGTALVRADFVVDGFNLGMWVVTQRSTWAALDERRRERLSKLPGWAVSVAEVKWNEGFARLLRYADEHGLASPPQLAADAEGYRVGSWVATQRQRYAKGLLDEIRVRRLEALPGWVWKVG